MTATESYRYALTLINKDSTGGLPIPDYERFFNQAQYDQMLEATGNPAEYQPGRPIGKMNPELSKKMLNMLSPFRKTIPIQFTNGIGIYNPGGYEVGDFVWGPSRVVVSGYQNPDCDSPSPQRKRKIPCEIISDSEWPDKTMSLVSPPTRRYPMVTLLDDERIEIMPEEIAYADFTYIRKPRPIKVGIQVVGQQIFPSDTDPNMVNPEWNDVDLNMIIWRALKMTGLKLQSDRMYQVGSRAEQEGVI